MCIMKKKISTDEESHLGAVCPFGYDHIPNIETKEDIEDEEVIACKNIDEIMT